MSTPFHVFLTPNPTHASNQIPTNSKRPAHGAFSKPVPFPNPVPFPKSVPSKCKTRALPKLGLLHLRSSSRAVTRLTRASVCFLASPRSMDVAGLKKTGLGTSA